MARWSWLLALPLGLAAGACFDAPQPAVHFSCIPDESPECPPGYTCQADGCCHRDGSDVEAHRGECQLGGAVMTAGLPGSSSGSGSDSGSDSGSGTTAEPGPTSTGSSEGSDSGTTAATDSGTTAASEGTEGSGGSSSGSTSS